MNIHPIITPASPSLASPHFDASFDSIESLTTTFTSLVVPTLETPTVTEDALGYHRNGQYSITAMTTSSGAVAEHYAYTAYGQPTILNASGTVLTSSAVGNRYTYKGREATYRYLCGIDLQQPLENSPGWGRVPPQRLGARLPCFKPNSNLTVLLGPGQSDPVQTVPSTSGEKPGSANASFNSCCCGKSSDYYLVSYSASDDQFGGLRGLE